MSSKTRRPNVLDKLVTKRDLLHVITAMNQATRALEERIEALEPKRVLHVSPESPLGRALQPPAGVSDNDYIIRANRETPA